ncbi:hypothetical protein RRG08_039967 [Elysia crispata]|uniref:Uncharacterized protein n=1 Tax=Elysia crispata TaxID=231223 RepID=A0AAE1DBG4_9GAST|nr:hypothetical protein RRG08_039967 [Elysia crispata]
MTYFSARTLPKTLHFRTDCGPCKSVTSAHWTLPGVVAVSLRSQSCRPSQRHIVAGQRTEIQKLKAFPEQLHFHSPTRRFLTLTNSPRRVGDLNPGQIVRYDLQGLKLHKNVYAMVGSYVVPQDLIYRGWQFE